MEALLALFRFLVPFFACTVDTDIEQALELAAAQRPSCLTPAQQDEAQIFYAAWLLYARQLQTQFAGQAPVPFGVKSEKEGDVSRTYGTAADGQIGADPYNFWGRYNDLALLCGGYGAITVGNRRGSCCGPFN